MIKNNILIVLIFVLALFLRFYKLPENLIFHGELGHNYLAVKEFVLEGDLPLIGPPTSHPWLWFGPMFYWIIAPVLILFDFSPVGPAYFFAFISSLVVLINFVFIKNLINKKVAYISSFLISISPYFLEVAREARFFSLIIPLFYFFLYFLSKIHKGEDAFIKLGVVFGLMLSFHYTPLILLPVIIYVVVINKNKIKNLVKFMLGILTPLIPLLVYDVQTGFSMTYRLLLWVPYRIFGFVGLYPKNNISLNSVINTAETVSIFLSKLFIPLTSNSVSLLMILIGLPVIYFFNKQKLLAMIFFTGLVGLFVHGDPPSHYFYILLPIPIIFVSILFSLLSKYKVVLAFGLGSLFIVNLHFYFNRWFRSYEVGAGITIPYQVQKEAVKALLIDSRGREFRVERVGLSDEFEDDYAQNYIYLLWLEGGKPVKNSKLTYTFVEKTNLYGKGRLIYGYDGLQVYTNEK